MCSKGNWLAVRGYCLSAFVLLTAAVAFGGERFNLSANWTSVTRNDDHKSVIAGPVKASAINVGMVSPALINEIVVNPEGPDSNCEYIELIGAPSTWLAGMYFATVEGDSNSTLGTADFVIDLTSGVLGTNGLLVVTGLDPSGTCDGRNYGAPSGTLVFRFAQFGGAGILENGTNSFLLIYSPTTAITPGMDLDTDNNGTLDGLPLNASVVDAVGLSDGNAGDIVYGGVALPRTGAWVEGDAPDMVTRFLGDSTSLSVAAWYYGDMSGGANSLNYDLNQVSANFPPNGALTPGLPNVGTASAASAVFDFDGDRRTDVSIFRPTPSFLLDNAAPLGSSSQWWILRSQTITALGITFGAPDDKLVPADFTGDGKADVAFWRPSDSTWYVLRSEDFTFYAFPFGGTGDIPAPGDFDGDGKADPAVYRPSAGTWFILRSSDGGVSAVPFGVAEDKPTVADFDGDGKDDVAVYRPSVNQWWQLRSTAGVLGIQFGTAGDRTAIGDYTGDGKADVAFYRPSTSEFFVIRSEDSSFFAFPWGAPGDIHAPGDYDGDGVTDAAVYRPSLATWFINGSTSGFQAVQFGLSGDQPIPNSVTVP